MIDADKWLPLARYLHDEIGYALPERRLYLVEKNCQELFEKNNIGSAHAAIDLCNKSMRFRQNLINSMTINESYFFREPGVWQDFIDHMVPFVMPHLQRTAPLRILVAACSKGQEVYTINMALKEAPDVLRMRKVEITAFDVDDQILKAAKLGVYSDAEIARGLTPDLKDKYFLADDGKWKVNPALQNSIRFEHKNMTSWLSFTSRFDFVFCRNVMIYFDLPTRVEVLKKFSEFTNPEGLLILGSCENTMGITDSWLPKLFGKTTAYVRDK